MDLLVISGSTRKGSFNTRLAGLIRDLRPKDRVTVVDNLAELPFYDADVETASRPQWPGCWVPSQPLMRWCS